MDFKKGKTLRGLVRKLSFIALGIGAFANPMEPFNLFYIGVGAVVGLVFGGLFRLFLKAVLSMFNGSVKKEHGKAALKYAIDNGMLFLTPFAIMLLIAVFALKWSMSVPFITAGIMAVGTASAIEMNKLQEKPAMRNTIGAAFMSFVFSAVWTLSFGFLYKVPSFLEGGLELVRSMMGGGVL